MCWSFVKLNKRQPAVKLPIYEVIQFFQSGASRTFTW
uniref:Uncharacterized protein n=1 Tax=Podoviridae sp. ctqve24 TaxID=2826580 RepID=A0A8S5MHL1_9CAUD|nr:MAG TPA: hypothetical protein [Podoviridae sp. ctqve24]